MVSSRQFFLAAGAIVAADQLTKVLVRSVLSPGEFLPVLDGIGLTSLTNTGSAFGLFIGNNILLSIVSIIACAAIIMWRRTLAPWKGGDILAGVILGGAAGNLIDRIVFGHVFDFISLGPWPAFNIADSALTLGVIALLYQNWKHDKK